MTPTGPIVVVHEDHERSRAALRLGIARSIASSRPLLVVHRSPIAVTVRNGPTKQVANQLGNPTWATVHQAVADAGADPSRTTTVVGSAEIPDLIARHAPTPTIILSAPQRSRWRILRRDLIGQLEARFDCPVTSVPSPQPELSLVDNVGVPERLSGVAA